MDSIRNPYAPSAGQRPPFLAGRDDLIEDFTVAVQRAKINNPVQHLLLPGLRGVGKTVLLNEFNTIARHHGGVSEVLEVFPDKPFSHQLASALPGMLHVLTKTWKGKESIKRVGSVISSFLSHFEGGINIGVASLKYSPSEVEAVSGNLEFDLADLLIVLGEEAQREGVFVSLLIDELHYADSASLSALVGAMHKTNQLGLPVIVVGAGLPTISKVVAGSKPYAERMFRSVPVGALDRESAYEAFSEPVKRFNVDYSDNALNRLFEVTSGYPYFIQVFGRHCWDVAVDSPIDSDDIEVVTPRASGELDVSFYEPRFEQALASEKEYLLAVATLGDIAKTSAVANELGVEANLLTKYRKGLIEKGLLYVPERGKVAFTVPRMSEYLLGLKDV